MAAAHLTKLMKFVRSKTMNAFDEIAARPDAVEVLAWRPGPGRAHIGWQFMHVAATDDRHYWTRMQEGTAREPELVARFAGGSTPDDRIPSIEAIRAYLGKTRELMLDKIAEQTADGLERRVSMNDKNPWTFEEWINLLAWHESHHHGQIHAVYNLYKARRGG